MKHLFLCNFIVVLIINLLGVLPSNRCSFLMMLSKNSYTLRHFDKVSKLLPIINFHKRGADILFILSHLCGSPVVIVSLCQTGHAAEGLMSLACWKDYAAFLYFSDKNHLSLLFSSVLLVLALTPRQTDAGLMVAWSSFWVNLDF